MKIVIFTSIIAVIIALLIGRYFRSKAIKDLHQKLKDEGLRHDVLVDSLRTEIKDKDKRAENFEAKLRERDEAIIKFGEKIGILNSQIVEREQIASKALLNLANAPKFQLVRNTKKRPAANDNYLYVEGELNGKREAGMLRLSMWKEAQIILDKNPEDRPV
jgi:hypothetical protein